MGRDSRQKIATHRTPSLHLRALATSQLVDDVQPCRQKKSDHVEDHRTQIDASSRLNRGTRATSHSQSFLILCLFFLLCLSSLAISLDLSLFSSYLIMFSCCAHFNLSFVCLFVIIPSFGTTKMPVFHNRC